MNANPLLDFSGLPRFDAIRAEHVAPAIDTLLAGTLRRGELRRGVCNCSGNPPRYASPGEKPIM